MTEIGSESFKRTDYLNAVQIDCYHVLRGIQIREVDQPRPISYNDSYTVNIGKFYTVLGMAFQSNSSVVLASILLTTHC
jgi:hypothetical protein